MAPSRHDWKIVDRDVKPQHNQHNQMTSRLVFLYNQRILLSVWIANTEIGLDSKDSVITRLWCIPGLHKYAKDH